MIVTADMMRRILESFGAGGKPTARVLIWMADKTVSGDWLEQIEFEWLEAWLTERGFDDPKSAICVQITLSQLGDDVFNGSKTGARRAVDSLVDSGVLTLVHKGFKGHGSLYLLGLRGYTNSRDFVYQSNGGRVHKSEGRVHKSEELVHKSEELVHIETPVTCGNADAFMNYSSTIQNSLSGGEREKEEIMRCPTCGSTNVERSYGSLFDCQDCRTPFVSTSDRRIRHMPNSRVA